HAPATVVDRSMTRIPSRAPLVSAIPTSVWRRSVARSEGGARRPPRPGCDYAYHRARPGSAPREACMLEDLRVVDLSTDVAGAYAAKFFATFGGDVIKVEPPEGDPTRFLEPRLGDSPDLGVLFAYLNTGKRSAVLDPADATQHDALWRLLLTADLVIETGAPGEWAVRGIDFDALLEERPAIVI